MLIILPIWVVWVNHFRIGTWGAYGWISRGFSWASIGFWIGIDRVAGGSTHVQVGRWGSSYISIGFAEGSRGGIGLRDSST
jgi:hypothetical protein